MNLINHNDRLAIFGARGMAGSAISRAFYRSGFDQQLKPKRAELDLLDSKAVQQWFAHHKPTVVVLAAAKVGYLRQQHIPSRLSIREYQDTDTCDRNCMAFWGASVVIFG